MNWLLFAAPHFPQLPLEIPALHIPDGGFLSLPVSIVGWVAAIVLLAVAIRQTRQQFGDRLAPLAGIMAAFIFAAQMINFPVLGGVSGHLLGGALAAIVLGPWAGMLVMASVILVQALLFQDGGLVVMGANILNMGLLTAVVGYGFYRLVAGREQRTRLVVAGVAAWLSVMVSAFVASLQLWLSGTLSLQVVLPAMLFVHALIGLGEALITVGALAFIYRTRPDVLAESDTRGGRGWVVAGLAVALAVVLLAPLASSSPDGLESVAERFGFIETAADAPYELLPDYTIPLLGETPLSTILAGVIGVLIVAGLTIATVRLLRRPAAGSH